MQAKGPGAGPAGISWSWEPSRYRRVAKDRRLGGRVPAGHNSSTRPADRRPGTNKGQMEGVVEPRCRVAKACRTSPDQMASHCKARMVCWQPAHRGVQPHTQRRMMPGSTPATTGASGTRARSELPSGASC